MSIFQVVLPVSFSRCTGRVTLERLSAGVPLHKGGDNVIFANKGFCQILAYQIVLVKAEAC